MDQGCASILPKELHGPGRVYYLRDDPGFVDRNALAWPRLDRDFLSQICYEHADRFDCYYPGFDPKKHSAVRTVKTAAWVRDNVRDMGNRDPADEWAFHIDEHFQKGRTDRPILEHMIEHLTWPFPPVIVEAGLAKALGAKHEVGTPYDLIEGRHRTSYLLNLMKRGLIEPASCHEVIEILPDDHDHRTRA